MAAPNESNQRPGGVIFAALFLVASVLLLSQLGEQAKFSSKAWGTRKIFAQPAFWPAVGVIGMTIFGLLHLIGTLRRQSAGGLAEAAVWLRSLEYLGWFMVYVFAVPIIGYLTATVAFAIALTLRAGYRGAPMVIAAAATGFGTVLIFKTALSVKIPGGAVYEYLPVGVRNFMILNF